METRWYDEVEEARTVDETVACVRRVLGALACEDPMLPRFCRPGRIGCDEDVDQLTLQLAPLRHEKAALEPIFDFVLHASLHIAHLNRARDCGAAPSWTPGPQMRQMG